jgi:large subunit ribosomal protein L13
LLAGHPGVAGASGPPAAHRANPVGDAWPQNETRTRVRTFSPRADDIEKSWHVVDAEGLVLGRLATEVARRLRGKHKTIFAPHIDTGDHVIVVNAAKVVLSADKPDKKFAYRHSGYPGGLTRTSYAQLLAQRP